MHATPRRHARRRFVRIAGIVLVALIAAYAVATWAARTSATLHPTLASWPEPPLVIAHQGGDDLFPSSTRFAYDAAATMGVDVLEMDVHLTSDGRLVVIHDATVDRTTEGTGDVAALTSSDLAALDAAYDWSPGREGRSFPYRGRGYGVPLLVDVLADHPDMPLVIEIKPTGSETAEALCATLRQVGRAEDAVVGSFHADASAAFRTACPEVATSATPNEVRAFLVLARARLAGPYRPPFEALQVPVREGSIEVITPAFVRTAHAKGVQVHAWTIDERDEMDRLLDLGVDGLITDRPDRALRATGRDVEAAAVPDFVEP